MMAQSGWAAEYTDCISAEGQNSPNMCPGYGMKQSHGEAPGMRSIPLLPLLPSPLWPGMVAPDRVLSMSQIELNYVHMLN